MGEESGSLRGFLCGSSNPPWYITDGSLYSQLPGDAGYDPLIAIKTSEQVLSQSTGPESSDSGYGSVLASNLCKDDDGRVVCSHCGTRLKERSLQSHLKSIKCRTLRAQNSTSSGTDMCTNYPDSDSLLPTAASYSDETGHDIMQFVPKRSDVRHLTTQKNSKRLRDLSARAEFAYPREIVESTDLLVTSNATCNEDSDASLGIQSMVGCNAIQYKTSVHGKSTSTRCPGADLAPSEPVEPAVHEFEDLSQMPESANQLSVQTPNDSYLTELIREYRARWGQVESDAETIEDEGDWRTRKSADELETTTAASQTCSSGDGSSDASRYGVSASRSGLGASESSSQNLGISNVSKRPHEQDEDGEDGKHDPKRQKGSFDRRQEYYELGEMIACICDNCPGLNRSISEWLRKLRTAHGIFICSRCWKSIERDQYNQHTAEKKCADNCVCDSGHSELREDVAQSPHVRLPIECAKTKERLKICQYRYICKLLSVEPQEFKRDRAKPHNGEKPRRRQQIADDITSEAEVVQTRCAYLEKIMELQKSRISELKGIILQFKELVDGKSIAVPGSLILRIKDHCPDILETVEVSNTNANSAGIAEDHRSTVDFAQDQAISASSLRLPAPDGAYDRNTKGAPDATDFDFQEYLYLLSDPDTSLVGAWTAQQQ